MAAAPGTTGLIDTDILIDAARGVPEAIAFLTAQQAAAGIPISIISAMELISGCRDAADLSKVQQFLQRASILPVTATTSQTAYQLMESFFLSHGLIIPDSFIAATALDHGLTLYTKNIRHFQMIPNLSLHRPY